MSKNRITREKKTVELMIRLYCRKKEKNQTLCPSCEELLHYAHARLDRCPMYRTLLQTGPTQANAKSDALFRPPYADLCPVGGNKTSVRPIKDISILTLLLYNNYLCVIIKQ